MAAAADACAGDSEARIKAALTLYFTRLREHPRPARVFLLEISGISPAVDAVKLSVSRTFSDILVPPPDIAPPADRAQNLLSTGMVGAVISIALRWVSKGYKQPIDEIVAAAAAFCRVALAGRSHCGEM